MQAWLQLNKCTPFDTTYLINCGDGFMNEYLSSRQQHVSINNQTSDVLPIHSGVPNGSLGTLLLITYFNDILNCVYKSYFC